MRFDVLTLFPDLFSSYLSQALLAKAIDAGLVDIRRHDIRDWAEGRHRNVDDKPFGGGPGMLMSCPPVYGCVEAVQAAGASPGRLLMMTPQGRTLDQRLVEELASEDRLLLLCGRYEGFDDRIRTGLKPLEVSSGDFICNGGEVPAMVLIDAVIRLVPGVLGDETSAKYESHATDGTIEHPQFTRPREFRGMGVPEVLLSGDHAKIKDWEAAESVRRTAEVKSLRGE